MTISLKIKNFRSKGIFYRQFRVAPAGAGTLAEHLGKAEPSMVAAADGR
jgi:hypothetical protein